MKILPFAAFLAAVAFLPESPAAAADVWSPEGNVLYVAPRADGFMVNIGGPLVGSGPCGNRFFLPASQAGIGYDAIVSVIVTALTANLRIQIEYDSATANYCEITMTRAIIYAADYTP